MTLDPEAELRKINRRHDEEMLAINTVPSFGRYLFLPATLAFGASAGWLAGRDIGRIDVWAALIAGSFLFSFTIHWLGHQIGRAWIAHKYRSYDAAANDAQIDAAKAKHEHVEFVFYAIMIVAFLAALGFVFFGGNVKLF